MSALLPPGSTGWLLAHELRVGSRAFLSPKTGRRSRRIALLVGLGAMVLLAATGGMEVVRDIARTRVRPSPMLYVALDVAILWLFTLMLAQTLTLATQLFYERNDLDLLLSSPIPPRRVLTVRALGLALFAATTYLVLASLLVIPLAFAGRPEFLAVYGVIAALALLAASAGLALALLLFAAIGPRRTRVISQIVAAVIGVGLVMVGQARNLLPPEVWARVTGRIAHADLSRFDLTAPYAWPARAMLGDGATLLMLLAFAALVFWGTTAMVGRRFAADASAGAGVSGGGDARAARRRAARSDRSAFAGGVTGSLIRKDLRLLIRDPWLISQVGLQLVYFCVLIFAALNGLSRHGALAIGSATAGLVFVCGQLAGNLTWVVISAEDAPELIACAPIAPRRIAGAKLVAGLAPAAALATVAVLLLATLSPLAALAAALGVPGAALSSGLMNLWYAKPANRREFRRRTVNTGPAGWVELLLIVLWAAAASILASNGTNPPMAAAALIPAGLASAILAVMRRPLRFGVAVG